VSGFTFATVGVIYAVLLAFVAVAVWQNFAQTDNQVQTEANLVGDLYRDPGFSRTCGLAIAALSFRLRRNSRPGRVAVVGRRAHRRNRRLAIAR
jgi:hypothetical protein